MKEMKDSTDKLLSGDTAVTRKKKTTGTAKKTKHFGKAKKTNVVKTKTTAKKPAAKKTFQRTKKTNTRFTHPNRGGKKTTPPAKPIGEKLRIIPLGGCEEVGRNMTVFEYDNDIVIVDMGLQWPEEDMPGIDYIIPNIDYLKGKEKNIRGVIITHGHYDHIGAVPHLAPQLGNPTIYGTPLTLGIIAKRQEDFKNKPSLKLKSITTNAKLRLGKFSVSFFGVSHNIPGSVGVIIESPAGKVVHTGDFKLDPKSSGDAPTEIAKIKALGKQNVLALMADSTNAPEPGKQLTEGDIQTNIDEILKQAPARIILGTFASLLGRIQQIIWAAERINKKVVVEGFSMKRNVELAQQLGYMKVKKDTIIPTKDMKNYPDNKIIILCTGAQGEGRAVLMRIANREHRSIRIEKGDTVVFSSSVIPGNERSVQRLKDSLYREGADVVHYKMMDIHAGGHAKQDDLLEMAKMVNPRYHIPVYGNHSFLKLHGKVAQRAGIPENRIFIPDNGQIMEFDKKGFGKLTKQKANSDYVFVDGLGVGDVSHIVLRDRQMMSEDGMVVVITTISGKTGRLVHSPDIISRGFIYMRENKGIVEAIRTKVKNVVNEHHKTTGQANEAYIKDSIRNDLGQFIFQKTQRRPMILPVVIEV
ncbi:ribonuclease J [Candidatus Parcubacteria bacterium]|jgi:ribonuclease J|nr:ribonuclease J [Candidatus Parcubacteria bacterium]